MRTVLLILAVVAGLFERPDPARVIAQAEGNFGLPTSGDFGTRQARTVQRSAFAM